MDDELITSFAKYLSKLGKAPNTIINYVSTVRRFRQFLGAEVEWSAITENLIKDFFKDIPKSSKETIAVGLKCFLSFVATRNLPAARPNHPGLLDPKNEELERLQRGWKLDKLRQKQEDLDDLIAKLSRKVIDHYLYFQSRLRGEPESAEELRRLAEQCQELLKGQLPIILGLLAAGHNVHPLVDDLKRQLRGENP